MDLNEDGKLDILSGSYSGKGIKPRAGTFQVLWGKEKDGFNSPSTLNGDDEKPLCIDAGDADDADIMRLCTRPTAVDWNGDGKLDIVSGNFDGTFALFLGKGKGVFASQSTWIKAEGKPLKVEGMHSDPVIIDIDKDGDLDLLSGSARGGVFWSENITKDPKSKKFELTLFKTLIEPVKLKAASDKDSVKPGHSTRIWVDDLNGDGKLDILLGDSVLTETKKKNIDEEAFKAWEKLREEYQATSPKTKEEFKALNADQMRKLMLKSQEIVRQQRKFLIREQTGNVWIYYGK